MCVLALVSGLIKAKASAPTNIMVSDISETRINYLKETLKINTSMSNDDVVNFSEIVFFAVKPNYVDVVASQAQKSATISGDITNKLFISIAAGVTIQQLES